MNCSRLDPSPHQIPLVHRFLCPECRMHKRADQMLGIAMDCLNAESVPADGPARVMRALSLPSASLAMQHHLRRRSTARALRRLTMVLIALIVAAQGWLWWIDRDPGIRVPEPRLPSPNAFDHFRAAGLALTLDTEIGEALGRSSDATPGSVVPLSNLQRMVDRNDQALRLFRRGLAFEYREPPIRSFSQTLPHYAKDRGLARLLRVEGMLHERRGRIGRANSSDLDAIEMGMRIRHGGAIIGALVGYACTAIGRSGLWDRIDRMSAQDARAALARLDRIEAARGPVADNLTEEKWTGVAGLLEIMRDPNWRWKLGDLLTSPEALEEARWRNYAAYLYMLPHSKRAVLERYMAHLERQVQYARLYPLAPKPEPVGLHDRVTDALLPVFSSVVFKDASDRCMQSLLRISLAVRAYRLENGKLPSDLSQLVRRGYLTNLPDDPFRGDGSSIRYLLSGGRTIIYSVGPDFVDNGGVPVGRRMAGQSALTHTVGEDSIGDIVAGVNKP